MSLSQWLEIEEKALNDDRQEKEHKQKAKLEEDVQKARTLDLWGNRTKKTVK